jgi:hypothetical protein
MLFKSAEECRVLIMNTLVATKDNGFKLWMYFALWIGISPYCDSAFPFCIKLNLSIGFVEEIIE